MKFAYQTQTKQYNDQSHLVSVEHGFVVNKTHTSIKKLIIQIVIVFRRYITVCVFCKICRKYSSSAHWLRLVSVLGGFLFDMQISLILKIHSISV